MSNVGTIAIEQIIPSFQRSHSRDYVGRHHIKPTTPLIVRAARRVAHEWTKPRAWTTALATSLTSHLNDTHADKVNDFLTGGSVTSAAARAWGRIDAAAYARLPKTWRHRLETAAARRREAHREQKATEAWWALRSADYPVLIPTQPMRTIERTTT